MLVDPGYQSYGAKLEINVNKKCMLNKYECVRKLKALCFEAAPKL